jgi:hypothetical protein
MALIPRFTGKKPTIQRFLSGSGTYIPTSADVKWIKVYMAGGGGGGAGSGTSASGGAGGTGGDTTFGSNVAKGGTGGQINTGAAGVSANTATLGTILVNVNGADTPLAGQLNGTSNLNAYSGSPGAVSMFGGAGTGTAGAGTSGKSNSGAGGGGGGSNNITGNLPGPGGCSGGYLEFIINDLSASYSYSVGAGGNAGAAGTSGAGGGGGGSGVIIVEEYYL